MEKQGSDGGDDKGPWGERGGWREEFWKAVEVRLTSSK